MLAAAAAAVVVVVVSHERYSKNVVSKRSKENVGTDGSDIYWLDQGLHNNSKHVIVRR